MKTISIFGGTGYIGTYLSTVLVKAGYQVRVFSRHKRLHTSVYCLPNVEYIKGYSYDDVDYLKKHLKGSDIIINLIGTWDSNNRRLKQAHIDFPLSLFKIAKELEIKRMVHISSLGVGTKVISKYLKTKFIAEQMLIKEAETSQVHLNIVRPSLVIGHEDEFSYKMASYIRMLPFFPVPMSNAKVQPIYLDDLVEAIGKIALGPQEKQVYELAGPKAYTMYEFISLMTTYIKGDAKGIFKLPDFATSIYTVLFGWIPGSPITRNQYLTSQTACVADSNDLSMLEIKPTPMESILPFELKDNVLDKYYEDRLTARR